MINRRFVFSQETEEETFKKTLCIMLFQCYNASIVQAYVCDRISL